MPWFATVLVRSGDNYREEARSDFDGRLQRLLVLLKHIRDERTAGIDTILFPAGYLGISSESVVTSLASRVSSEIVALETGMTVICGIDSKRDITPKESGYPWYIFVTTPDRPAPGVFRQLSMRAPEGRTLTVLQRWGDRSAVIDGTPKALLICGEARSDLLRRKIAAANASVLLVPAHQNVNLQRDRSNRWAKNYSWHITLDDFFWQTGVPVILAEHTRKPQRHAYAWGSKTVSPFVLPESLRRFFTVKLIGT